MTTVIELDGSHGEGGGQILRTALGLSMVTGTPFRIASIRAGRTRPGLLRQHLAAVRAAALVADATITGDELGSTSLTFRPRAIVGGRHEIAVGSAGSTTLVLQAVLPALLSAPAASELVIEGGTHAQSAPSFDFLSRSFLPLLARMGGKVELTLDRLGFYPAGGGRIRVRVEPSTLSPLELIDRGAHVATRGTCVVASIPRSVAEREAAVLVEKLGLAPEAVEITTTRASPGPGNAVTVEVEHAHVTESFVAYGARGVTAEAVASSVAREARAYLAHDAPVGPHLADQLLLLLALARGGRFRTSEPTEHTRTHRAIIEQFLDVAVVLHARDDGTHDVSVTPR
jgi:RNA 3'-terminal phosphate cyclase (ATP)